MEGRSKFKNGNQVASVWVLEDPANPDEPTYQIVPITASIWAPEKIFLKYDRIVFTGEVGEDS